jgi:hypothetical protein
VSADWSKCVWGSSSLDDAFFSFFLFWGNYDIWSVLGFREWYWSILISYAVAWQLVLNMKPLSSHGSSFYGCKSCLYPNWFCMNHLDLIQNPDAIYVNWCPLGDSRSGYGYGRTAGMEFHQIVSGLLLLDCTWTKSAAAATSWFGY